MIIDNLSFDLEKVLNLEMEQLIDNSDVIIICKKDKRFLPTKDILNDKKVIDFVRLFEKVEHKNYIGLCW